MAAGELSADTGALYTIYAAFADPRLPAAYRGDDSNVEMSGAVRRVLDALPRLEPATRAQIAPFLLPPSAPESWHEQREAGATLAATKVAWRTIGEPGEPFKVWYQPRYGAADAQLAQYVYDTMRAEVWPKLTALMGEPLSDITQAADGGDGAFDIYLVSNSTKTVGYTGCERSPAHLLLDRRDYSDASLASMVMYAILYGYDLAEPCAEYEWLKDATAVWATDYVFPDDQTEHTKARGLLDASFNFPILTDQSALSLAIDGSLSYGGRGWITPVETIDINDSCGPTTLHVDLRDWWKSAVTVEEADALFVAPDGRTISGSYTNGAGGVYRWELKALPRE